MTPWDHAGCGVPRAHREGAALAVVLIVLLIVSAVGVGLLQLGGASSIENAKSVTVAQAFWSAEAGLEEAKAVANKRRLAGKVAAPDIFPVSEPRSWTGQTARGGYRVSAVALTGTAPSYTVLSEGYSRGGATAAVQMVIRQVSALSMGLFGADRLAFQPNQTIDSTPPGQASAGSNGRIEMDNNVSLNGSVYVGADAYGSPAAVVYSNRCATCAYVPVGNVDADPLGIVGGPMGVELAAAADPAVNDNERIPSRHLRSDGSLQIRNGETLALSPGTYYFTGLEIIGSLVATGGSYRIFLTGTASVRQGNAVYVTGGIGTDGASSFRVYQSGSGSWNFQPGQRFMGLLYAPYAYINFQPNNEVTGVVWGRNIDFHPQNNAQFTVDMDLLSYGAFSNVYALTYQWQQVSRAW